MILKNLRKSQKLISSVLIFNFTIEILFPLKGYSVAYNTYSSGGGTPIAASLSSMVDGYTGDFNYSVPLINVPGPNGENVPISAGYHAGIGTNQKASWIGLGWDYNPGEISRNVVGTPDDYNAKIIAEEGNDSQGKLMFGALYSKNIKNNYNPANAEVGYNLKSNDYSTIYRDLPENMRVDMFNRAHMSTQYNYGVYDNQNDKYRFNRSIIPFQQLACDEYNVSGGISGKLNLENLSKQEFFQDIYPSTTLPNSFANYKDFQFYFSNSSNANISAATSTNSTYVNQTTNRIHSSTYVKYYTNSQINSSSNLYSNSTQTGFLDYRTSSSGDRRPANDFDPDGIGGFEITDASGITYHYSLPVYNISETSFTTGYDVISNTVYLDTDSKKLLTNDYKFTNNANKYAVTWKLTSVTGTDYQDSNNNKMVDEGDKGYWISYNYSLWSDNYKSSSLRYDYKIDGSVSKVYKENFDYWLGKSFRPNTYKKNVNVYNANVQVYYLNYIKTATHTAYFIKSVRKDEQSYDNIENTSVSPTALLKLEYIVLLRNQDKDLLINSTALSSSDKPSAFSYTTNSSALGDNNFMHVTKYNNKKADIDKASLKTIQFVSDYSLCRNYTGNINTVVSSSSKIKDINGSRMFFREMLSTPSSGSNYSVSGKLTLKKILTYELNGEKITPSTDFDYSESDSNKNPDFNQDKTDLWGFYKSDYKNSHYVTDVSKDYVSAWSLRKIITPLGAQIEVEYEADRYHKEGFSDDPDFIPLAGQDASDAEKVPYKTTMPHLIFPIKTASMENTEWQMYDYDYYPYLTGIGTWDCSAPVTKKSALIVNMKETCTRPTIYYNGGNSSLPATETLRKLTHRGSSSVATYTNCGSAPSSPSPTYTLQNVINWNSFGKDISLLNNCSAEGQYHTIELETNNIVNFVAFFRSHLFGGGVRVKSLKIKNPSTEESYTQEYTYGNGYCAVVPKPQSLCYGAPFGNYDITPNYKPLISSELNSRVGYDFITTKTTDINGNNNGYITTTFNNEIVANPLTFNEANPPSIFQVRGSIFSSAYVNWIQGCNSIPVNDLTNQMYVTANYYYFSLILNKGGTKLGLPISTMVYNKENQIVSNSKNWYNDGSYIEEISVPCSNVVKWESYSTLAAFHCTGNSIEGTDGLWSINNPEVYSYSYKTRLFNSPRLINTVSTTDGISMQSTTNAINDITGFATAFSVYDPTKGAYTSSTSYAYLNSSYTSLGLKSVNETYKNQPSLILSGKTIKNSKYVVNESNVSYSNVYPTRTFNVSDNKYVNANSTNNWYRVNETYSRLLNSNVYATSTPQPEEYRKTSKGTLYDLNGNRIEEESLNGRKSASKWGYSNKFKLADISNANYNSFAYSGFEDQLVPEGSSSTHFGGEIINGQTRIGPQTSGGLLINPHTGNYMSGVAINSTGPQFETKNFEKGRTYLAKVWVHKNSPPNAALTMVLNGTAGTGSTTVNTTKTITKGDAANVIVGDWVLMTAEIAVPDNFNYSSGHYLSLALSNPSGGTGMAYFDDLSFHPKDAVITGNVYNEQNGLLVAQLDNENFATLYNYDNAGRIISTYKEYSGGTKKLTENQYHFAKP